MHTSQVPPIGRTGLEKLPVYKLREHLSRLFERLVVIDAINMVGKISCFLCRRRFPYTVIDLKYFSQGSSICYLRENVYFCCWRCENKTSQIEGKIIKKAGEDFFERLEYTQKHTKLSRLEITEMIIKMQRLLKNHDNYERKPRQARKKRTS